MNSLNPVARVRSQIEDARAPRCEADAARTGRGLANLQRAGLPKPLRKCTLTS
jgi:hypothetical protein